MKTFSTFFIVVLVFIAGTSFYAYLDNPQTDFWCRHIDINIKTGQVRETRMRFYRPVSQKIEDTLITNILAGTVVNVKPEIDPWQRVYSRGGGPYKMFYSPHYRFHSATSQITELETIFEVKKFLDAEKKEIVTKVLTLWQQSGRDNEGGLYIMSLLDHYRAGPLAHTAESAPQNR
ncbi:MAG: hypothetical protein HZB23_01500 [Deltaproteobacteria bacterium]|nr:hypothetical protein [Deltaproteobacteria bacterium]